MKLRKLAALALAAAMAMSVTACGGSKDPASVDTTDTKEKQEQGAAEESNTEEEVVINFFHRWPNDPKNAMFKIGRAHV